VAYAAVSSGGGSSGLRDTLLGSVGWDAAMVGTDERAPTATPRCGDGAWHEPPQPQSYLRCDDGDATDDAGDLIELTAVDPAATDAVLAAVIDAQDIAALPAVPSNESMSGS
jgi:hypothetical protein